MAFKGGIPNMIGKAESLLTNIMKEQGYRASDYAKQTGLSLSFSGGKSLSAKFHHITYFYPFFFF